MADTKTPEWLASAIFNRAVRAGRAGEVMDCLFEGGSVTLDAVTGDLVLISADQLAQIADTPSDRSEEASDG